MEWEKEKEKVTKLIRNKIMKEVIQEAKRRKRRRDDAGRWYGNRGEEEEVEKREDEEVNEARWKWIKRSGEVEE